MKSDEEMLNCSVNIIEGVEGSGKSYALKQLQKLYGAQANYLDLNALRFGIGSE